jgi:HAD superfamily hydrolase (TIGR01549 family)
MDDQRPVVLFDWGETLMWVPGMIHDPDRHLACVESIYETGIRPHLGERGKDLPMAVFIDHYHAACRTQIAASKVSQREHTFDDRFAMAVQSAGLEPMTDRALLRSMSDALGSQVVQGARLLEDAAEVIETLARSFRLGVVSNYPHGPVVAASLERFGLLRHFKVVVVSSDTGWMKPHADCYLPALAALPAPPGRTLMVGDDLTNDVKGAKALGLHTAWIAPKATAIDPDVDIHLKSLAELPAHCARLFGLKVPA